MHIKLSLNENHKIYSIIYLEFKGMIMKNTSEIKDKWFYKFNDWLRDTESTDDEISNDLDHMGDLNNDSFEMFNEEMKIPQEELDVLVNLFKSSGHYSHV